MARALVFNPRVLLMDEPLGALDKQLREHLQLEIKALHEQLGVTIIYVTHDQEEALVMSDRIAVMNKGRIEQCGLPYRALRRAGRPVSSPPSSASRTSSKASSQRLDGRAACVEAPGVGELRAPMRAGTGGRRAGGAHGAAGKDRRRTTNGVAPDMNAVTGTVDDVVFVGEMRRYVVAAPAVGSGWC